MNIENLVSKKSTHSTKYLAIWNNKKSSKVDDYKPLPDAGW